MGQPLRQSRQRPKRARNCQRHGHFDPGGAGHLRQLVQNQLLTAHTANTLRPAPVQAQHATNALRPKSISIDIEELLGDTAEDETDLIAQDGDEGLDEGDIAVN